MPHVTPTDAHDRPPRQPLEASAESASSLYVFVVLFTAAGQVSLTATRAGDVVSLAVADSGPGDPAGRARQGVRGVLSDRESRARPGEGPRPGPRIVRGLGRLLGHPVRLRSQPERPVGTELVIDVPAGDARRAALTAAAASAPPPVLSLAGRRVLVLDDERDIRAAMRALLESWQCEALTAATVEEALEAAAAGAPDLVLCDYRLPNGLTGADALSRLEAELGQRFVSVIITGDTSPERIREAKSLGRPVLFKSVVPGKLRALLHSLLPPPTPSPPHDRS